MIPSLGRTVHYILPDSSKHKGQHRAAVISQVWADPGKEADENTPVQLHVYNDTLNDAGTAFHVAPNVTQDPHCKQAGSWHEPERVVIKAKGDLPKVEGKAA